MKSLSRRVCPKTGKAIPPVFRSIKNSCCFSKCFQFCARPLRRPARAHCTQRVWGQPWLVAAEKFCICMCVTLLSVSPSIHLSPSATSESPAPVWGSARVLGHVPFTVMGCKHCSLKRGFLMWDLSADLLLILLS